MYGIFIAVILLLLVDLYFFQAVKTLVKNFSFPTTAIVYVFYWAVTAAGLIFALAYRILPEDGPFRLVKLYGLSILLILSFCKLMGILPVIADDFIRLIKWSVSLLSDKVKHSGGEAISRSKFLSQFAFVVAAVPFAIFLYGMVKGAFNYQVRTSRLFKFCQILKHPLEYIQYLVIMITAFIIPTGRVKPKGWQAWKGLKIFIVN